MNPTKCFRKRKRLKFLYQKVEWSDGNGNVRMKPRELNEKDREELSFLFNLDYEMSMGEEGGWKGDFSGLGFCVFFLKDSKK